MARPRLAHTTVRVSLKLSLRPGQDDDLLNFFAHIPPERRAAAVCQALRAGGMQTVELDQAAEDDELFGLAENLLL